MLIVVLFCIISELHDCLYLEESLRPNLSNMSLEISIILQWHYCVISL